MSVLPPDPVFCFKGDMGHIHNLSFCTRGNQYVSHILAATEKGIVYFWDLETNRLQHKQEMGGSLQAIHSLDFRIITQEKTGSINLWEVKGSNYEVTHAAKCTSGYCKSILVNESLIVADEDGSVEVLDVNNLEKISVLKPDISAHGHVMALENVTIDDKVYIMGGYETGDIILWDMNTFKPCSHLKLREQITSLTFDPITRRGICGNSSNALQMFTIDRDFNMTLKLELSITNEGCNIVKLRPDRKVFVSGGWDGRLRIFSWKTFRILTVLAEHKGPITDIQFSPSPVNYWKSNIMAASGADGVISLWNLYN